MAALEEMARGFADRLINVEIDGLLRHQILLPSCAHEARHRAESLIDLTAGEVEAIRETKHLMVSLSAGGAEDAGDRGRTDGLVGVRVNALSLREAVDVPQPTVSTGAPVAAGVAMIRPETGYAVINAAGPEDAVEVDARWQPTRRGRFRTFSGSRPEIAVRATDVHGRQVDIDVVQSSADGLRLQIPAGSGPVHLRFEGRRGAQIPEVGLRARTLRGPTEP